MKSCSCVRNAWAGIHFYKLKRYSQNHKVATSVLCRKSLVHTILYPDGWRVRETSVWRNIQAWITQRKCVTNVRRNNKKSCGSLRTKKSKNTEPKLFWTVNTLQGVHYVVLAQLLLFAVKWTRSKGNTWYCISKPCSVCIIIYTLKWTEIVISGIQKRNDHYFNRDYR